MKVSWEWLSEFVDLSAVSPEEVAELLTLAGLEVEGIERLGAELEGLLIARVEEIAQHPNADRLRLVTVDAGAEPLTVVCGAPNVAVGQTVILAPVGASMPGFRMKPAKIRGVVSEGMIVSEAELGLPSAIDGIWALDAALSPGLDAIEALGLKDVVLDLSLTPNRPDCLSIHGVARELAAALGRPLQPLATPDVSALTPPDATAIEALSSLRVEDSAGCPRYSARVLREVQVGQSPWWIRRRLHAVGLRALSNVVDVTNYVLMEWGQPLHAFDLEKLDGGEVVVRRATEGERLITLDGGEHTLRESDLVIADASHPIALAGVMGGQGSEVGEHTRVLLLEAASFDPSSVRRTARNHGLHTDSSHRFERGTDPGMVLAASARALQLLIDTTGGVPCGGILESMALQLDERRLKLSVADTNRLLGTGLEAAEMLRLLGSIGLHGVEHDEPGQLQVVVPSRRLDLERPVDLMEEIARLYGYDRIPGCLPVAKLSGGHTPRTLPLPAGLPAFSGEALPPLSRRARLRQIRQVLSGLGCYEHVGIPLVSLPALEALFPGEGDLRRDPIRLQNPLAEEHGCLRTSLLPTLLSAITHNGLHGNANARLFELGRVFLRRESGEIGLPREPMHLGIAWNGQTTHSWAAPERPLDVFDLKGLVQGLFRALGVPEEELDFRPIDPDAAPFLHPGAAADIFFRSEDNWHCAGVLGELHPGLREAQQISSRTFLMEIEVGSIPDGNGLQTQLVGIPRFPAVERDIALVLDESVPAARILRLIREHGSQSKAQIFRDVRVFDLYRGPEIGLGRKSLAVKVRYQADERTLTDAEVNGLQEQLLTLLTDEGAEVRGIEIEGREL